MQIQRVVLVLLFTALTCAAHVSVWPRESQAGITEKYVLRVPGEGQVATTEVELEVPANVRIVSLGVPAGWTYDVKREGNRIIRIVWKMKIERGEFAEFPFMARNPKESSEIVWKVRQRSADGTFTDWAEPASGRHPAPVTKVK